MNFTSKIIYRQFTRLFVHQLRTFGKKVGGKTMSKNKLFSNDELAKRLTAEQYDVCAQKGTEMPFSGEYDRHFANGTYICVVCGHDLFSSEDKFDSGCGWPAFSSAKGGDNVSDSHVVSAPDDSISGRPRVEILCQKCNSHLGHVFDDGPQPTNLRYCVNSVSLRFKGKKDDK